LSAFACRVFRPCVLVVPLSSLAPFPCQTSFGPCPATCPYRCRYGAKGPRRQVGDQAVPLQSCAPRTLSSATRPLSPLPGKGFPPDGNANIGGHGFSRHAGMGQSACGSPLWRPPSLLRVVDLRPPPPVPVRATSWSRLHGKPDLATARHKPSPSLWVPGTYYPSPLWREIWPSALRAEPTWGGTKHLAPRTSAGNPFLLNSEGLRGPAPGWARRFPGCA
jgi:hypothetical protein